MFLTTLISGLLSLCGVQAEQVYKGYGMLLADWQMHRGLRNKVNHWLSRWYYFRHPTSSKKRKGMLVYMERDNLGSSAYFSSRCPGERALCRFYRTLRGRVMEIGDNLCNGINMAGKDGEIIPSHKLGMRREGGFHVLSRWFQLEVMTSSFEAVWVNGWEEMNHWDWLHR